jgi:membrane protein
VGFLVLDTAPRRLLELGKRLYSETKEDDISGAAAELAYRLFLAVFPFFIFLAALGGFVAASLSVENPTDEIMNLLGESLPPDAASVLRRELDDVIGSRNAGLLSIGLVLSIWAASSGAGTLMKTLNRIYGVRETRPIWKRYAIALGLTLLGGVSLIGAVLVMLIGQVWGLELASDLGVEGMAGQLFTLVRLPITALAILAGLTFLYWSAPNLHLRLATILPGAILAMVAWLVVSYFFSLYVANFGSYSATYGTLGSLVAVMVWLYLSGFILLLGAEVNVVRRSLVQERQQPPLAPVGPPAGAAPQPSHPASAGAGRSLTILIGGVIALIALGRFRRRNDKKDAAGEG